MQNLAVTDPGGRATLNLRPLIAPDPAPPNAPDVLVEVDGEHAPTTRASLGDRLTEEQRFEIWAGLRHGKVENQSLFNLQLQRRLTLLGFDTNGVDGILGEQSRAAARLYVRLCEPQGIKEREINPGLLAHMSGRRACGYSDAYAARGIRDADNGAPATTLLVYHTGGSYLSRSGEWQPLERADRPPPDWGEGKSAQQIEWEKRVGSEIEIAPRGWPTDDGEN
ncbi:MAG: hypothetical protein U5R48_18955 [Gammaproteobacteria bacterium]|nr:hypothetical protein [Gammaproteobacteria bacterium]